MTDVFFTDQEENLVDILVSSLYKEGDHLENDVNTVVAGSKRAGELFSSAINSVSFHQREREDYIIFTVFGEKVIDARSRKRIVLTLFDNISSPDEPLKSLDIPGISSKSIGKIEDPETLNQLGIYRTVENNLLNLQAQLLVKYNIMPVFPLLKNLSVEKLQEILSSIESYINYSLNLEEKVLYTDLPLPKNLNDLMVDVSPNLPVFKKESTLEKVDYFKDLFVICDALIANKSKTKQQPDYEQVANIAGKALALMNAKIDYK